MIPLKSLLPRYSFPIVTVALIVINFIVFFHQLALSPRAADAFIATYALVPSKISFALAGNPHVTITGALLPLFTCMFLHGGWMHIIGNMWFLWIFGANVEDRLGPVVYLLFYLVSGVGSSVAQLLFSLGSPIPSLGASGAISGVLGAYLVYFTFARILTLVPLFIIWFTVRVPAMIFIGLWFLIQFFSGVSSMQMPRSANMGGVAWWAHVGGFLLGVVLAKILDVAVPRRAPPPAPAW
jgi:membrane associated rhomboid family serine protease